MDGECNGEKFTIKGEGYGDAHSEEKGVVYGKYVCTSGERPMAWEALVTSLSYGAQVFSNYPGGITDFYKSCFPKGYTQDREIHFDNDGVIRCHQEVTLKNGALHNKVTLKGENFKPDGHVLTKNLAGHMPSLSFVIPEDDGIKLLFHIAFPLKTGGYTHNTSVQKNKGLWDSKPSIPLFHWLYQEVELTKDPHEPRDHMCIKELLVAKDSHHV